MGPGSALKEQITYWGPLSTADRFGEQDYSAPVLLKGRWVEKFQQITGPNGDETTSSAMVYLNADVAIHGRLARGDFATNQVVDPRDAAVIGGSQEVQAFQNFPDLRNMSQQRIAYL